MILGNVLAVLLFAPICVPIFVNWRSRYRCEGGCKMARHFVAGDGTVFPAARAYVVVLTEAEAESLLSGKREHT